MEAQCTCRSTLDLPCTAVVNFNISEVISGFWGPYEYSEESKKVNNYLWQCQENS